MLRAPRLRKVILGNVGDDFVGDDASRVVGEILMDTRRPRRVFEIPVETSHLASYLKSSMQKLSRVPHDARCVVPNDFATTKKTFPSSGTFFACGFFRFRIIIFQPLQKYALQTFA